MKPVHQTQFGGPDAPAGEVGNCFPACLASVLGIGLDEIPHFHELHRSAEHALDAMVAWSRPRGFVMMTFDWSEWPRRYLPPGHLFVGGGKSPRGDYHHAVVCEIIAADPGWRVVHDPHPSGDGLDGALLNFDLFIPILDRGIPWPY